ncbi:hypothetical protein HispidOSU_017874, partial [Sigmodon hispidus]
LQGSSDRDLALIYLCFLGPYTAVGSTRWQVQQQVNLYALRKKNELTLTLVFVSLPNIIPGTRFPRNKKTENFEAEVLCCCVTFIQNKGTAS